MIQAWYFTSHTKRAPDAGPKPDQIPHGVCAAPVFTTDFRSKNGHASTFQET